MSHATDTSPEAGTSLSPISPSSSTSPRITGPHRRSSKACETCRVRRVKCTGSPPCEACSAAGLASTCTVRLKARPKRAPSAKLQGRQHGTELSLTFEKDDPPPPPPILEKRNPLEEIELALSVWCTDRRVPFSPMVFKADMHLANLPLTPLAPAPEIHEIEDQLMASFLSCPDDKADSDSFLLGLYTRYRSVPGSITDDQRALLYATMCIASFNRLGSFPNVNEVNGRTPASKSREDVTYFRMACDCLARWNRPSLMAIWSLFYLIPYTMALGGPGETKDLLDQWAWHVRALGLHHRATAELYQPSEQVGKLFSAIFYMDIFRASLTDLQPSLPLDEIDVDPRPPADLFPESLRRCSHFTAKFLAEYNDPHIDTAAVDYVLNAEASCMPFLRELRHARYPDSPVKRAWAQFRYHWLRILHYTPHLAQPELAPQAYAAVSRAIIQILYTYADLVAVNQLYPSWPQVRRLVVCGQLLILCYEYGEIQPREGGVLFQMLVEILSKHQSAWPVCATLAAGFADAARVFDINVSPDISTIVRVDEEHAAAAPFNPFPYDFCLDFELSTFAIPM